MKDTSLAAVLAASLAFSSLAAFCQNPSTANCVPPKVVNKSSSKSATAPAPAPAVTPAPAPTQPQQQSIVVNVPPVNLEPLVAPFTIGANAKMRETYVLENLGDVDPSIRADLVVKYAEARIKVTTAQATLTESEANVTKADAALTNTKRKWYVFLHLVMMQLALQEKPSARRGLIAQSVPVRPAATRPARLSLTAPAQVLLAGGHR
jgi:hypothetical protein